MTPKNDEEASTSSCSEEEIHNLLGHLGIDDSEGVGLETISKQLGQLVIDEESDDDDCDSDAEEVLKTVPDSEDSEDPCLEVVTKCSPTSAVVMILEGSRNSSQEDIVNRLRERCDTLKDTVDKVKFLTERVSLVLGYPISALMYSIFTNKIQIVQFLVEELYHKCALSNSQVFHFLDQRDKDGNNLLLAMAASPLDLSDTFKLLLSFQYTYSSKKYFMVNAWATNQREETIWDILKRNEERRQGEAGDKERLERTLRDVIQNSEFQQSWIGDVMSGANNYREETPQRIEESLTQVAREVNEHHPNPEILHHSQPQVVPDPNQILEEEAGHLVTAEDGDHNDAENNVDGAGDNVVEAIPVPVNNLGQPAPAMMFACDLVACGILYQTRQEADQCAQAHGGHVDVMVCDPESLMDNIVL